jgi:membrane-bound lytic murein transglycosylase A
VAVESAPRLAMALREDRASLISALDRSLAWFARPSSAKYFPMGMITHEYAQASVAAFRQLVTSVADPIELEHRIYRHFDLYESEGSNGDGTVLFSGYYSPAFPASLERTDEYRYPLYAAPRDLVIDPVTGEVKGRRVGHRIERYPSREEIERSGMLRGLEIVWLRDRFDAYLIHVQGSAALLLTDGRTAYVSYAGHNAHDYVSVARQLVADGELREDQLNLEDVRTYFRTHPDRVEEYLQRNPRFVFFRLDDGSEWPMGSLGVKVTALRSIATDKTAFPPGGVTLVVTRIADEHERFRYTERFMLDQDSGGAIRTPGRVDIYFGAGLGAEARAGAQYAEGRLFYLFLKPQDLAQWRERGSLDF